MKIQFVLLGVLFSANVIAGPVDLNYDDRNKDYGMGHRYSVPIVSTDGDDVIVKSDSIIENVTIIIKDQFGNIMHQSVQTITPDEFTISVPDNNSVSEKTTIDLYYEKNHLTGYFDE